MATKETFLRYAGQVANTKRYQPSLIIPERESTIEMLAKYDPKARALYEDLIRAHDALADHFRRALETEPPR